MMTAKIRNSPIALSIIFTLMLTVLFIVPALFLQDYFEQLGTLTQWLLSSVINIIVAVIAMILLGIVNETNGFKHVFKTKGLAKGLIVLIPATLLFIFGYMISLRGAVTADNVHIWTILFAVLSAATSALMQNILFRGLLATALLVKHSGSEKVRVRSVFKAAALFWVVYILMHAISGNGIGHMQLVNTFIVGSALFAAYLYSRNLMSLVLAQWAWGTLGSVMNLFVVEGYTQVPLLVIAWVAILALIVVFTVKFSKRAEPFYCC